MPICAPPLSTHGSFNSLNQSSSKCIRSNLRKSKIQKMSGSNVYLRMHLKCKNHLEWQVILRYFRMYQEQQNTAACYSQVPEDAPKAFQESKIQKFLVSMPPDLNTMCVHGKHTDLYTTALPPLTR